MALLEVTDLTVEIRTPLGPVEILREVALSLERGESLGLVGESGCGKSMTALAIMGLLPQAAAARGRVALEGTDLLTLSEAALCDLRGRRLAMIFQEPMTALNPVRSIGDQVAEGLRLHLGLGKREAAGRAAGLLERVGLPAVEFPPGLYPHQLSGGQRQRVMIAMALACGPDILIADEPTTALDVTTQAQILDLIAEVAAEEGMALILISHDLGVIAEMTDRVAVMYAGAIVESGATAAVFRDKAHPYTQGLFAALPSLSAEGGAGPLPTIPGQVPDPLHRPPGCAFATRCPRASAACREAPRRRSLGAGHEVSCFHPLTEAAS